MQGIQGVPGTAKGCGKYQLGRAQCSAILSGKG